MPSRRGAQYKTCFNCKESGHISSQCPKPRGILNWTCGGCGRKGHTTDDCPNRDVCRSPLVVGSCCWSNSRVLKEWVCKNCTEHGHGHWECEKPRGYRYMRCGICSTVGHVAKFCKNRPVS
ncbi:hypothetical protein C8Q80DRAFT_1326367 [Daedaleopsis nitida]|nr:hypothetical protein C8Q80DRAFT_1326367 [Daedaleopsis nitida]